VTLDTLSPEAFSALRLAFNDIWTAPEGRFRVANEKVRQELLDAKLLQTTGAYCQLTPEGLVACKATFGALIEKELAAQAQGGVVRVPFKGR
jgi:hypothetical protein